MADRPLFRGKKGLTMNEAIMLVLFVIIFVALLAFVIKRLPLILKL